MAVTTKTPAADTSAPADKVTDPLPQLFLLELCRVGRFFDFPTGKLYERFPGGDNTKNPNAFEFDPSDTKVMMEKRDPHGLPLFRPARNRKALRAARDTEMVGPARRRGPDAEIDTAMSRWAGSASQGVDLGDGDNDPELAAIFARAEAAGGDDTAGARAI